MIETLRFEDKYYLIDYDPLQTSSLLARQAVIQELDRLNRDALNKVGHSQLTSAQDINKLRGVNSRENNIQSLTAFPTQIQHVIVLAFESRGITTVMTDPYWVNIANTYARTTNYTDTCNYIGGGYPCWCSLPSYMSATSGTTSWNGTSLCGSDSPPGGWGSNNAENIFDLINKDAKGLTYATYAENWPGSCSDNTNFASRHFPSCFYTSVKNDTNPNKILDFSSWTNNVLNGSQTPANFVWITPNLCNDGHDCGLSTTTTWLRDTFKFDTIVTKPWFQNAAIFLWYDDAAGCCNGKLYFVSASPISKGLTSSKSYNHYNALSTFEWLLGLPATGNGGDDPNTKAMTDLFTVSSCVSANISLRGTIQ